MCSSVIGQTVNGSSWFLQYENHHSAQLYFVLVGESGSGSVHEKGDLPEIDVGFRKFSANLPLLHCLIYVQVCFLATVDIPTPTVAELSLPVDCKLQLSVSAFVAVNPNIITTRLNDIRGLYLLVNDNFQHWRPDYYTKFCALSRGSEFYTYYVIGSFVT